MSHDTPFGGYTGNGLLSADTHFATPTADEWESRREQEARDPTVVADPPATDRLPPRTNGNHQQPVAAANDEPKIEFNTDLGNAGRFVRLHRNHLRYVSDSGYWICWNGHRWEEDRTCRVVAFGKETALSVFTEAQAGASKAANCTDDGERAKLTAATQSLMKWAIASQKRERISAMIALSQPDLAITAEQLDGDPLLLNCGNGTVDLRTGELRDHQPEDFICKLCNADFRPGAIAPTFLKFLDRVFRSKPDLLPFIQRAAGYCATGLTAEQCLFFLFGNGANGKTTMVDAICHTLGDYASKADPDLLMMRDGSVHPCNVADLMGRRLVVCSETTQGRRYDESKLKDLVGETRLKARLMRQNFFEFPATHKIVQYGNHRPIVRGTDHGLWRRMKVVPFVETIGDDEKDKGLLDKLKAEADGILAWIVAGAVEWHQAGLNAPDEITRATAEYRTEMDSIGAFITEKCIEAHGLEAYAKDLYAAYTEWCEAAGERALSQKLLGTSLTERGYVSARCSYSGRVKWTGIGIRSE